MPNLQEDPLSYVDRLDKRDPSDIELVVIHATELPDLETAREYGERIHYEASDTGNSGHFYIDRDGAVHQWVPLERVAHHVRGHNRESLGIELVNLGRYPNWLDSRHQDWPEAYSEAQIESMIELLHGLKSALPNLQYIAGHDELDTGLIEASDDPKVTVRRKVDPGPLFPWDELVGRTDLKRYEAES
jgi:N-acetylmuramoyl-L-alanine amidase